VTALAGIDLSVKEREFIAVVGPSGCGKSTIMMLVAGLSEPTNGTVTVGGRPVLEPLTDVGIVFQRDLLMDWRTVTGNIMLQAEVRRLDKAAALEKARALIRKVGLAGFEDAHPWQLSGGMRQRVAICRALLYDAPLLLLDEPFGALDALTRDEMNADLQRVWSSDRRTAIFITHDIMEAIFLADRVIVMSPRPGRIVADVRIDLERPREIAVRETPRFIEYQRAIRGLFESIKANA
jgi:NitT/TauT family transport system ATP-binding protein